jgi:hypothetical protein
VRKSDRRAVRSQRAHRSLWTAVSHRGP